MRSKVLFAIVFVGVALALGFLFISPPETTKDQSVSGGRQVGGWETQVRDEANISVAVTPIDLQSPEWRFAISMDTHSVPLDHDMVKITTLTDDRGNVFVPIAWEGAQPGGHHREGELIFREITPWPVSVQLNVGKIGGVARVYSWKL